MDLDNLKLPDDIYRSAEFVMGQSKDVYIDESELPQLAKLVTEKFHKGFGNIDEAFGSTGDLHRDINLIFFETAVNFCFWSQTPEDKWKVKCGDDISGGWYGLRNAFTRALKNNLPVYDADFMSKLNLEKARELFLGQDGISIPLLEQRVNNIVEAANFLNTNFDGSAAKFVKHCKNDAPTIAAELARSLNSYRDGSVYAGKWVWILKRAQIFPNDLSQLSTLYPDFNIKNKRFLTIFADYKLPQLLRYYGVINYSKKLAEKIDNLALITCGSEEEIEIRMATILACQKLSKLCPKITVADIDVSLWLMSKEPVVDKYLKPHHMTVSVFY